MDQTAQLQLQKSALLFVDAYNKDEVNEMLSLFQDDSLVSFIPMAENRKGKIKELGKAIWSMLLESFVNIKNELIRSRFEDNGNLIYELKFTGYL